MAKDISLLGATYHDVPAVTLPKSGGGTATFIEESELPPDGDALSYGDGRSPYAGIAQTGSAELGF